jgi:hypothetical protein
MNKQTEITIGKSVFQIKKLDKGPMHPSTEFKARYAYELTGHRSSWRLLRNQNDPELLFGINKETMKVSKWWLRENRLGELVQIQVDSVK